MTTITTEEYKTLKRDSRRLKWLLEDIVYLGILAAVVGAITAIFMQVLVLPFWLAFLLAAGIGLIGATVEVFIFGR